MRARKPRVAQPPISQRYRPSDVVRSATGKPTARTRTSDRLRPRAAVTTPTSGSIAALTTGLRPSLGSPRLGSRSVTPRSGTFVGYASPRSSAVWGCGWGWNNSWCANTWGVGIGWGYRPFGWGWAARWNLCSWGWGGFSPWVWNVGVLAPYYAWHTNYWNTCYQSAYWNNWSVPNALPSSYWWYPSTTYCPTYLYVPSSTVVVEDAQLAGGDAAPAGDVVGAARAASSRQAADALALAESYVELGVFYFQSSRYEDAAEAYAKARNYMPEDASVHLVLADAVFANGDYHYASFLVSEAVRLDPSIVTAETDKRTFYGRVAEFEAQLDALQRYCADKPYDAWAQLLLGYNLRFSDRPTRAIASFRRVLELDRDNAAARAFLTELEAPAAAGGR